MCLRKLRYHNQGLNRALGPGSPTSLSGSRSEISISHSNQSTRHPVDRRLHYQIQEHSHPILVAAGVVIASCSLTFLATLLAMVLSIQVANVVLTTVVADQSVARTQSPEAVAKMALASDVVVVTQVSRQLLTPTGRSRQRIQGRLHSAWQGKGSNSL